VGSRGLRRPVGRRTWPALRHMAARSLCRSQSGAMAQLGRPDRLRRLCIPGCGRHSAGHAAQVVFPLACADRSSARDVCLGLSGSCVRVRTLPGTVAVDVSDDSARRLDFRHEARLRSLCRLRHHGLVRYTNGQDRARRYRRASTRRGPCDELCPSRRGAPWRSHRIHESSARHQRQHRASQPGRSRRHISVCSRAPRRTRSNDRFHATELFARLGWCRATRPLPLIWGQPRTIRATAASPRLASSRAITSSDAL